MNKKKHRVRNFIVLPAIGLLAAGVIAGIAGGRGPTSAPSSAPAAADSRAASPQPATPYVYTPPSYPAIPDFTGTDSIVFEITGSGTGMVTYSSDSNFSIAQETGVDLPWSKTIEFEKAAIRPVTINAQHTAGAGAIGCRITINGKVAVENSSSGQYAVVSCTTS
ncbi:MmpS family transport accessory protein [Saccharopolyspora sp. WRP15-2]|uniref:MmpS family transport accessory protein n=1 Tax=Saccharopolyspora oryzae TaxID=2997343 RepID=A0ABT4UR91_9PSEU|nr:MmpS family transport accessory protein [Saccharopolyspora oryzae]MDA3624233.1 MmpS family transport accessory protein [Saccharopolyspora oryzae]